jgi:hypothetical protein
MSTNTIVEPPAVKKRGRPKKAVAEDVGPLPVVKTTDPVMKKAAPKAVVKEKVAEAKKEKKTPAKQTKAAPKKDAPRPTVTPQQPTPVTPATSKILKEIRAKGTLGKAQTTKVESAKAGAHAAVGATQTIPPVTGPLQPTPAAPTSTSMPDLHPKAAAAKPTPTAPTSTPVPEAPSQSPTTKSPITSPTQPSSVPKSTPPTQRTTTIPLPRKPATAPSPVHPPPKPSTSFAKPTPSAPRPANPYPSTIRPSPLAPRPLPQHHRIIEPTPDIRLPPKYKPAARRVTAIIVGIPVILVFGYELYNRWQGEIQKKFEERHRRV